MRFVKRRNPALRPALKPEGVIVLEGLTRSWKDHVKAWKEARRGDSGKGDQFPTKPDQ